MRATLIYNVNAGGAEDASPEALLQALGAAGYDPILRETQQESDLDEILRDDIEGIVVVAGGDGTMRAVASRLVSREVPLVLLPMGTANNVSKTLGIRKKPLEIVEGLETPRKVAFDVGRVRAPWGEHYFIEAMGFGFFADNLALYDPEEGKSIFRGISTFTTMLGSYRAYDCRLILDGEDITDEYLLVEVLNTKSVGPRLRLAPNADPTNGFLDVITVRKDEEEGFLRYVTGLLTGEFEDLPSVDAYSGKRLEIEWKGFPIHVDDEVLPGDADWTLDEETGQLELNRSQQIGTTVVAEIIPHALELWLPR